MRALRSKLTYANVISTLCLFMLLGGGAYAATKLPKNSVGAKQIKNGAITGKKIKNASIEATKLTSTAQSTLQGPKGPRGATGAKGATGSKGDRGPAGPTGPAGTAGNSGAFATVLNDSPPTFQGSHPGFTAVERDSTGIYCLTPASGVDITHPLASSDWYDASGDGFFIEPLSGGSTNSCLSGKLEVHTYAAVQDPEVVEETDDVSFTVFVPGS
jgi:hypothetical protein